MMKSTRCAAGSKTLRKSMLPVWPSSEIFKSSTKMTRRNSWIQFATRKRKSRGLLPYWTCWWVPSRSIKYRISASGTRRRDSTLCHPLLTVKKTSAFPNYRRSRIKTFCRINGKRRKFTSISMLEGTVAPIQQKTQVQSEHVLQRMERSVFV